MKSVIESFHVITLHTKLKFDLAALVLYPDEPKSICRYQGSQAIIVDVDRAIDLLQDYRDDIACSDVLREQLKFLNELESELERQADEHSGTAIICFEG